MKVLLVTGYGDFANKLIAKLSKNKHTVFVLTGTESAKEMPAGVFEQYNFPYTTNLINEILASAAPDAVIFLGAFDTNLIWNENDTGSTASEMMSALVNIQMSCSVLGIKHFIFLSSDDVFGEAYDLPVDENIDPDPVSYKGKALLQAEKLAVSYGVSSNMEVTIVRIDNLFCIPNDDRRGRNKVSDTIIRYFVDEGLSGSDMFSFSFTYVPDAVEAIHNILNAPERQRSVYHISSGELISDLQLCKTIEEILNRHFVITDLTTEHFKTKQLSNGTVADEFGFVPRIRFNDGLIPICKEMSRHMDKYLSDSERQKLNAREQLKKSFKNMLRRFLPFLEALIFLVFILWLRTTSIADQYLQKLDFFLLYVLLFSVTYGKTQSVFTGILSVFGYMFVNNKNGLFETFIDFNTYVWIAQIFIVGLTVGHIRDNIKFTKDDKDDVIRYVSHKLNDMEAINESVQKIKDSLEHRIIDYDNSLGSLYKTTSELDVITMEEILYKTTTITSRMMETKDVAVYRVVDERFCRLFSSTSAAARTLGKWMCYADLKELYTCLEKHTVFINREMTPGMPLLSTGIYVDGRLDVIIMLWGIPMEKMTLYQANELTVLSGIVSGALRRGMQYNEAIKEQRFISKSQILQKQPFSVLVKIHEEARDKLLSDFALLRIVKDNRSDEQYSEDISAIIREYDNIGYGDNNSLLVLLTNTGRTECDIVLKRLEKAGIQAEAIK